MPNQALQQTPPHVGFWDYDVFSAAWLLSWLFGGFSLEAFPMLSRSDTLKRR
jgi:hypothetical protein